jgi:hypothetical protein
MILSSKARLLMNIKIMTPRTCAGPLGQCQITSYSKQENVLYLLTERI